MYTLAGIANPDTGWGCAEETWSFMAALSLLGGETWFRLGDRDLATHVERSRRLQAGMSLTAATRELCKKLRVTVPVLPMSDVPVSTRVHTADGELDFQDYFVARRAEPAVTGFSYAGAATAPPAAAIAAALTDPNLAAIIIAPSNPWLSIAPILAIPSIAAALRSAPVPVVAVSPLVAGKALKGPTAKIMGELGLPVSSAGIAAHYRDYLQGLVLDEQDAGDGPAIAALGITTALAHTVMHTPEDRRRVAGVVLDFARTLRQPPPDLLSADG
jgi:LPPG:FO 2-phospho-L-lactate transferase